MTPAEVIAAHGFRGQDHGTIDTEVTCGCGWYAQLFDYDNEHRLAHGRHVWERIVDSLREEVNDQIGSAAANALTRLSEDLKLYPHQRPGGAA